MNDETNTQNPIHDEPLTDADYEVDDTPVEGTGQEVGFHAPGTFAEFEALRPTGDGGLMPLRTAVKVGLRNGYATLYSDVIRPVLDGHVTHGNLAANEAIIGDRFIQMDSGPNGDNLLLRTRVPKHARVDGITAQLVGKTIRDVLSEGMTFAPRSMVVTGQRQRTE
jgi:hypothetical protein